jgi:PAS domain S-box-containing protein
MIESLSKLLLFIGEGPRGEFWNIYSNLFIYIALVYLSFRFYKKTEDEFFNFLGFGFLAFIVQKALGFFAISSMYIWDVFTLDQMEPWFPAMEHYFETVAILMVSFSFCYISFMFRGKEVKLDVSLFTPWKNDDLEMKIINYILFIGLITSFIGYLIVAVSWVDFFNNEFQKTGIITTFSKFWADILIEYIHAGIYLASSVYIAYRIYPLKKGENKHIITTFIIIAFSFGFFGHLIHIIDLAQDEINMDLSNSVKRTFEFLGNFFFFGIVFFRLSDQLDKKRTKIEQTLKEVREFTKAFFKISEEAKKSKYLDFNLDLPEIKSDEYLKSLSFSIKNMIESIKKREENVQASSQELQVLNEELSSTYEELRHIYNDQEKHLEDLQKSQGELIAEKNKVDAILSSIGDGISIQDRDFNIVYTNDFYYRMFGKGIVGKKCYNIYEREDDVCDGCPLKQAFDTGEVVRSTRTGVDKSGDKVYVDITASPIIDEKGEIIGGIELAKDVTKRLVLENQLKNKVDELNEANEKLIRMDKIKTNFVGMASHELRTPLTMIKGYSELLMYERSDSLDDVNIEMVENIHKSSERLNDIISDILDISRIDDDKLHLNRQKNELSITINQTLKDLKHYVDKRVHEIIVDDSNKIGEFFFDSSRLYQVLTNLIANAIKYTPDGGKINITSKVVTKDSLNKAVPNNKTLKRLKKKDVDFVEIIVKDNGIGIDVKEQKHIFDRFYEVGNINEHTTSKSDFMGGGAGLGLSICKGIVEAHGGAIWVESEGYDPENKKGSEFHILIPYLTEEERERLQEELPLFTLLNGTSDNNSDE